VLKSKEYFGMFDVLVEIEILQLSTEYFGMMSVRGLCGPP
jgi:hypothetical protein